MNSIKSVIKESNIRSGEGSDIRLLTPHKALEQLAKYPDLSNMIIVIPDENGRSLTYKEFLIEQIEKLDNE